MGQKKMPIVIILIYGHFEGDSLRTALGADGLRLGFLL